MNIPCYISGLGSFSPSRVLTNSDLEKIVDTTDEWIQERTGIKSRHMLDDDAQPTDLATEAARKAVAASGFELSDITHIVLATCTPEYLCPGGACVVAQKLDLGHVMAFDINAACSGFLYGLDVARGMVATHPGARVLLVGVEGLSRRINWEDRTTCVLFGDGAGATVVTADKVEHDGPTASIIDSICLADGKQWRTLTVGGGTDRYYRQGVSTVDDSFFIRMSGREVFKFAVRNMTAVCKDILGRNNMTLDDIDMVIPHQANMRIIEAIRERVGIPKEKMFVNIEHCGNTSSASIPLALTEAWDTGRIRPGQRVLLVAFGGGFTWGATLLQF